MVSINFNNTYWNTSIHSGFWFIPTPVYRFKQIPVYPKINVDPLNSDKPKFNVFKKKKSDLELVANKCLYQNVFTYGG